MHRLLFLVLIVVALTALAGCVEGTNPLTPPTAVPTVTQAPTSTPTKAVVTTAPTVTSTSGVVVVPPPGPRQPPQGVSGVCKLDKIGTWSETQSAQPYRIEVGGGGTQHADLYPKIGVKAISIVVPPQFPKIVFGFGSIWEGNGPECQSFDYATDAANYAKTRMQNNHSGVAVDFRGGTGKVVGNAANLSVDQINGLLAGLGFPAISQTMQTQPTAVVQQALAAGSTAPSQNCESTRTDRDPVVNVPFTPQPVDSFRIIEVWTNQPGFDQKPMGKLLLKPGEAPSLLVGGAVWVWPKGCEAAALSAGANLTVDQLPNALVR